MNRISNISSGWNSLRLLDVCERTNLTDPRRRPDEPFTYIDVSSVSNETMTIVSTNQMVGREAPSRARRLVRTGDVIFATVRPALRRIAMIPTELDSQICSTGFCVLRAREQRLDPSFLYFYLQTGQVARKVEALQDGATYPAIRDSDVLDLEIVLPPIDEQRAVARSFKALQEAIEARRRELALERERKAVLMHHLFTHGTRGDMPTTETRFGVVPSHWRMTPLADVAKVQSGVTLGRRFNGARTVRKPYLRVANVQDGFLDLSEIKEVEVLESEVNRYRLEVGDVLLTEGGDADKLGRGFIWAGQIQDCLHQNHIFAVRADREAISPEFLVYLIQSPYGKAYFLSVAHRTTNLASINSTKLKAFPVLVPNHSEQQATVNTIKACDDKISAIEMEVACLTELFQAMLDDLMTGRLPVSA